MKNLVRFGAILPVASAAALGLSSAVQAADFTAFNPTPPTQINNLFNFGGVFSIRPILEVDTTPTGTIFVDFNPAADPTPPPVIPIGVCTGETAFIISAACTAAINTANASLATEGQYNYGVNGGTGFFDEFESTGFTTFNGAIGDIILPIISSPTGRNIVINDLLRMDAQTLNTGGNPVQPLSTPLSVDNGSNVFNMTSLLPVTLTQFGSGASLRTDLSFTVLGTYVGPDTGPRNGTVSFTSQFDGLTIPQVQQLLFVTGANNISYSANGTLQTVPEPGSILGLGVAAASGLLLRKGKKQK